jgi:hypothetical protein
MRKVILRSLGLAVGLAAGTASAPDARAQQPPVRGARLGMPVGVGSPDPAVTPAGLLTAVQDPAAGPPPAPVPLTPLPMPTAAPPVAPPRSGTALMLPAPTPLSPAIQGTPPAPTQIGPPTPLPGSPSVTEVRNPGAVVPGYPAYPGYPILDGNVAGVPFVPEGGVQPGVFPPGTEPCPPDCPTPTGTRLDRLMSGNHFYAGAEYLMWWTRSQAAPPLLTTSPPGSFGILGAPGTRVVYGGGDIGDTLHGGGRFTVGDWFGGCDPKWGIEGRIFFLGDDPSTFTATSGQYPVLARPYYNANTPHGPFSELVTYPGLATGYATVKTQTELWGAEANLRRVLFGSVNNGGFELDALVGYRFMDLDQRLTIQENFFRTPGSPLVGTPAVGGNVTDIFHTRDLFNGGQIGLNASYQRGPWFVESRATVAFGDVEQTAFINGGQTLYFPNGAVGKYQGGLLALPGANIGTWRHSQFGVLPEVGINLGYQITSHVRVFVGYDFLYLGNILQPGDTVPTTIDASRIPNFPLAGTPAPLAGNPRPAPIFHTSDFFAQGINFGVQVKW